MSDLLKNYLGGRWVAGSGAGTALFDPVLGDELVRVDATGLDLRAGFAFARESGGAALRAMTYRERAAMLAAAVKVLQAKRDDYYAIATANSGTVKNDSAVDIDGGIYTLSTYAKLGEGLGERRFLLDGEPARLAKEPLFQSRHVLVPTRGLALFINAFNFPSWGLWEKAAPALLSGVPVVIKPATATAWLTQRMVKDVVDAGVLPAGALSVVCGSSAGLMDALQPFDVVSFTGSAETAAIVRGRGAAILRSAAHDRLVGRAQLLGHRIAPTARQALECDESRVPAIIGDRLDVIASGPFAPDPTTFADAQAILARYGIEPPEAVKAHLARAAEETPKPGDPRLATAETIIIAKPQASLEAAAEVARRFGISRGSRCSTTRFGR